MAELPPHLVADVDQRRAELAELVAAVRDHADADMCIAPLLCPGDRVASVLYRMGPRRRHQLLYVALGELAQSGYGLPLHLTEAAVAALDEPTPPAASAPARRWWWPWRR